MESEKSNVTEIIEELKATPAAAECVNHGENIAVENDWLEMRYTADRTDVKKESREEKQEKRVRRRMRKEPEERAERSDGKLKGVFTAKKVVAALLVIVVLAAAGVFFMAEEGWAEELRSAALAVFGADSDINVMTLSATTNIDSISEGDVVVKGGRLVLTLTSGKVCEVTDSSVSIQADKNTVVVYGNMSEIAVVAGADVNEFDILGRYEEMTTINVYYRGVKITDIVEANRQLVWQV